MKQVFQTDSTSRWKRFLWSTRVILFLAVLLIAVFVAMLLLDRLPTVPVKQDFSSVVMANKPYFRNNALAKTYKGFRDFIKDKKPDNNYGKHHTDKMNQLRRFKIKGPAGIQKSIASWTTDPSGIRSAFYVTWDPLSYVSLKENIGKLNLVLPEWYFINPKTLKLEERIDHKGYQLMKRSAVPIMPILTNNYDQQFNAHTAHAILNDATKRTALIHDLITLCKKHGFTGFNIDFEELSESGDESLVNFIREASQAFHAAGLYLTQDIEPFNSDYNVKELAKYADYLFLMAYDEHSSTSEAGPVSSQKWIEAAVDHIAKDIPEEKIILGLAAYGYDWTAKGDNNQTVSYREALSIASDTDSPIHYDEDTYNLNFGYRDDTGTVHTVYFNDAATHFNTIRFGVEYGLAGFAVWRLGTEDSRLWQFYPKNLTHAAAARFRMGDLEKLSGSRDVSYLGTGEVLDVIDTPKPGYAKIEMDYDNMLIASENYEKIPSCYQLGKYGRAGEKELLLTFDDGPDSRWTPKVLDILKHYHVSAAFFMVGLQMEKNLPIVKQVADCGYLIGNHTFTHGNVAEQSAERTALELKLTRLLLESITGNSTILFRAPYNADSDPTGRDEIIPIVLARKQNYLDVGEAVDPEDWMPGVTADQIFQRIVRGVEKGQGHIILLHDAGGDTRIETIKALPRVIEYFQNKGYRFITLDKYLGKTRNQLMPPIPKGKEYYAMQLNLALATIIYDLGRFLTAMFIIFIILGVARLLFMMTLTVRERRRSRRRNLAAQPLPAEVPLVSIIVPAYNEEVNAVSSLQNLLQQDYPNFNIVFVDDGSRDETYKRVTEAFAGHARMQILTKPNGGKASALNYGIEHTEAQFVVCIDADTKLHHDAVSLLMHHFLADPDGRVGGVAGNVKVGNQRNILTRWQAIEYTTSQNFDRQAYANINAITVVPGAIGAFRRQAILDAGGLTTDTLAEDCDLTIRVIKAGYIIENENAAVALTEAPEKLRQFMKQRTRWSFGVMQTFWKHRALLANSRYHGLGLWAFPNMLIFQFVIPTFSPIADLLMLAGLFSGNAGKIFLYYLIFTLVDCSVSLMAYLFEREKLSVLFWIIPQRFFYRWIMYVVLFRSYKKAIKGELQQWGVLKRTGNVKDI